MKKLYIILLCLIFFPLNINAINKPSVTNHEKIVINMFRGKKCGSCKYALDELKDHIFEYNDYLDFKIYEVWYNNDNNNAYKDFLNNYNLEGEAVPLFVIGDNYYLMGYDKNDYIQLIEKALDEYQNENYVDVIKNFTSKYNVDEESFIEACESENIKINKSKNYMAFIVIPIAIIVSLFLIIKTIKSLDFKTNKKHL